jgi:YggT family protein
MNQIIGQVIDIYSFIIIVRVFMTWIPNLDPHHPIVQMLRQVTDPVLEPARRLIPSFGMMDFSPIVVIFALRIIRGLFL